MIQEMNEVGLIEVNKVFESQQANAILLRQERITDRIKKLRNIKLWIENNSDSIKEAIYKDFKKPASEVDITEIYPVLTEVRHAIGHLKSWVRPKRVEAPLALLGTYSYTKYEPKGVCLIIAPWNFPFNLTIGPLVSAIAAGNTAIVKPSEMTPNTSALMQKMVEELFDKKEVSLFQGGIPVTEALLSLPFDHIFFTGSPSVGKIIMKSASAHLTSVTLELGGKSPVILDESVNVRDAAEKVAWGKFLNNGQTCIAPDYLLVHKSVANQFIERLKQTIDRLFKGGKENIETSADYARIVNDRHYQRLIQMLETAVKDGAQVAYGGVARPEENYISPTLVTDPPLDGTLMNEEIFGPILPIITYDNMAEAIQHINKYPKPLALYYFGKSKKNRKAVTEQTSSGAVCINESVVHFNHANLPFGGVNNSGIGKSHGRYGFEAFSNMKPVLKQRVGFTSTKFIYPPYTPFVKRIISLLVKYF